ncbi:TetR/AcrR family transcriptional regulator [Cohnella suwonensis]|uniref:TetR/AcrR family transcriptional regulator n=1 Tax=Cohnella suwonensis TaxID=696072 RepID=A0ABW0M1T2_9BACL
MSSISETRKQQILDAAADFFLKSGFHKATMADICSSAKMSPGSVYRYFKSKEEIIEALYIQKWETSRSDLKFFLKKMESSVIFADDLVKNLLMGLSMKKPFDPLFMEMRTETLHNPRFGDIERNGFLALESELAQAFSKAQQRGNLSLSVEPEKSAKFFITLLQGLVMNLSLFPEMDVMAYSPLFHKILE